MRDTDERDQVRKQYADQPGVGHHVERTLGELENAEAYGDEVRARTLRGELDGFGHRSREQVAGERRAAAEAETSEGDGDDEGEAKQARRQPPAGRTASPAKQTTTAAPAKQTAAK